MIYNWECPRCKQLEAELAEERKIVEHYTFKYENSLRQLQQAQDELEKTKTQKDYWYSEAKEVGRLHEELELQLEFYSEERDALVLKVKSLEEDLYFTIHPDEYDELPPERR